MVFLQNETLKAEKAVRSGANLVEACRIYTEPPGTRASWASSLLALSCIKGGAENGRQNGAGLARGRIPFPHALLAGCSFREDH